MDPDLPESLREGAFAPRPAAADKYSVGTVAVIGGCADYPHAPVIAALGARAAGAGLVRLSVPDASRFAAAVHVPEATFAPPGDGLPRADVRVIGPGLGRSPAAGALAGRLLAGEPGRWVVDADALFFLAAAAGRRPAAGQELVLTPHEGEAARLLGRTRSEVASDRLAAGREIARRHAATVVLKGPRTLVVAPGGDPVFENPTGNPLMALGGMGDLLAGVVAARWAYLGGTPFLAVAGAVWLHGLAADRLAGAGRDPSLAAVAAEIGSLRVRLDASAPTRRDRR